jgi:hypothetical protein
MVVLALLHLPVVLLHKLKPRRCARAATAAVATPTPTFPSTEATSPRCRYLFALAHYSVH